VLKLRITTANLCTNHNLCPPIDFCALQAKEALNHPYFDDLDKATVDALENPELEGLEDE
jgi:hypothetical protein